MGTPRSAWWVTRHRPCRGVVRAVLRVVARAAVVALAVPATLAAGVAVASRAGATELPTTTGERPEWRTSSDPGSWAGRAGDGTRSPTATSAGSSNRAADGPTTATTATPSTTTPSTST